MTFKLRRNHVVSEAVGKGHWSPFGRVIQRIDDNRVKVVFCTKEVAIFRDEELISHPEYKGRYDQHYVSGEYIQRWNKMPTLRKLKQMASRYNPDIWKKQKRI